MSEQYVAGQTLRAVALRTEKGEVLLPFDDIEKARLVPQF